MKFLRFDLHSPPSLKRLALAVAFLIVGVQIVLLLLAETDTQRVFINDLMEPVASLLAFGGMAYGAYWSARRLPRLRLAWIILAGALLSAFFGDTANFFQEAVFRHPTFPAAADLFYLIIYPSLLVGVMLLPAERIKSQELSRFILDIAIVLISSILVFGKLIQSSALDAGDTSSAALVVRVAYPTGDLILSWALLMLFIRPFLGQPRRPLIFLLGAGVLIMAGDILAVKSQASASLPSADWLNVLYLAGPFLMMLSGIEQAIQVQSYDLKAAPQSAAAQLPLLRYLRFGLPYVWLVGAYFVLVAESPDQSPQEHILVSIGVAVIILLVIVRQILALDENHHLTLALQHLNNGLEERVEERTSELSHAVLDLRREMEEREHVERVLRDREDQMAFNALHDSLTGLPNRTLLIEHIGQEIRKMQLQDRYHYMLLFLDFDGFKIVNDSLGHLTGDLLLVEIALRLRTFVREGDTVARLGGDEFVILLKDISPAIDIHQTAGRLQQNLSAPFMVEGHIIYMTASVGVVVVDECYQQPADILRDADLAMYAAKAQGKDRYVIFTPELRADALDRMVLESDLHLAQQRGELLLNYQPILALEGNTITGFEALIRWQHPERGLIWPADFIPLAETSGLIVPITRWVLHEACAQVVSWQKQGKAPLTVSVNLSPKLFSQTNPSSMVDEILVETGLEPQYLKLEITEGAIIEDAEDTRDILLAWQAKGIQVFMDDFGTGYSALSYLHRFPIDTLKIDRAFIKRMNENGNQGEIVRTIIALARELKINVIAEGVETTDQLSFLKDLGCQSVQGFLISRPIPPSKISELLLKYAH